MELRAGYKSTVFGMIPADWDLKKIGPEIDLLTGCPFPSSGYSDTGVRLLRGSNVKRGVTDWTPDITQHWPFVSSDHAKYALDDGDLVIAMDGSLVGRSFARLVADDLPALLLQRVARIRSKNLSVSYLTAFVGSDWFIRYVDSVKTVTAIPHISPSDIEGFSIPVPPTYDEQERIATALSDVDALIAGLEKLIAKKRDLKQAAMQQLLTGQTRLPGFSGEWVVKRLGEICEISMGRTPSRLNPAFWGAGHVWLSIADLHGKVLSSSKEQITPLAASSMRVIPKGTLLMSFKLSIGRLCFAGCDLYTNEAICGFNNLQANSDYLYYALSRTDFSLYGKQAVKGYTLNKKSLALVEVALPSDEEQAAIANVLSSVDVELLAVEARLSKTRELKQGMMQELLTGRTRLI